ncbi:MAG TPA: HoxN/HupN/NixA family nickel/cobalt transporter [Candidatus Acidoferrales bacterium]|nr:HoxN/HupN/NixA family nickel/cobalt transporter [Candidatus Acidoferrales bacterium]
MVQNSTFSLSQKEKISIALIFGVIALVTTFAFSVEFVIGKITVLLAGLGIVAYVFGLRHGVDADHIAAIDNTTRKLIQEGKRPFTVGLWFSLGHSTVVVALIVGLVFATRTVAASLPALQSAGSIIGTVVSGSFLWIIGIINAVVMVGIYKLFQELKKGKLNQAELETLLENRGFMNRFFRPLFKIITKPWQIFPIGVLFGLGFDTASEVALIAISVGIGVSTNIPVYYLLILPLLFTCGMVTVDTIDGVTMRVAYGWAFLNPLRKIYYNLTVTATSVIVAWAIGTVELLQVLSNELNFSGWFWSSLKALDFELVGFGIIAIFVASWIISLSYWKFKKFDSTLPFKTINEDRSITLSSSAKSG